MEKIETKIKKIEERTHSFYCDECGTQLGCSTEHEDGYYQQLGEFKLEMFTPMGWHEFDKCFCANCRDKYLTKLYEMLESAGFELKQY